MQGSLIIRDEDIVCSNRNIRKSVNHATAYSMIGYICGYLRYYYPTEFITAFLNSSANDEDIKNGTDLANIKGIEIIAPRFRYSTNIYSCDSKNKKIYKGTSSIKGLSKVIGDKLYELKDKEYNSFLDLLIDCRENGIGISDLTTLAKLDYFNEFGKINKILKCIDLYNELYGKKILKKDKEYGAKLLYLKHFCSKETDKQYSGFDSYKCLIDLFEKVPDNDISIKQKASYQLQYFGYIDLIDNNINSDLWFVLSNDLRGKNHIIDLYSPFNGEKKRVKVRGGVFDQAPFDKGSMLSVGYFDEEGKWSFNNETNKWTKSTTEKELILKNYKIVIEND